MQKGFNESWKLWFNLWSRRWLKPKFSLVSNFTPLRIWQFVGSKAKGRITKWVFQENKARQTFQKNKYFLLPDTCAYQEVNVRFSENLVCFVFLKHPLWDSPFYLITDKLNILFRDNRINFNIFLIEIEKLSEFLIFLSRFFHSVTMNGKSEFLIKSIPNNELRSLLIFLVLYVLLMVGILLNRNLGELALVSLKNSKFSYTIAVAVMIPNLILDKNFL